MGAPISSFRVFNKLAKKGKQSWEYEQLKKFRLFSFILHSPNKHQEFHNYLESNLHVLDARTRGGNLIFFTLVKPSEDFRKVVEKQKKYRGYIAELQALEEGIGIGYNEDASVFALSKDLGIPESALPCIVITNDFIDGNIVWFSTNKRTLGEDLSELHSASEFENDDMLISAVRKNPKFQLVSTLEKSFAQILAEAFSLNAERNTDIQDAGDVAKNKIKTLLQEVKSIKLQIQSPNSSIPKIVDLEENEILFRYEDMMIKILSQILAKYEMDRPNNALNLYKQFLEPKSFEFLQSGYKVLSLFGNENDFDFSSAVMPLAKSFENEINYSIIQWLRSKIGIKLPDFYCQYQPSFGGSARIGRVNLNDKDNETGFWKPLPIGVSKYALSDYLVKKGLNSIPLNRNRYYFDENQFNDFIKLWEDIRLIRNKAGHSENLTQIEGLEMAGKLKELLDRRYFLLLSRLKNDLRM